jgi:hypothetical protein
MSHFHVTLTQGRADSFTLEANSLNDLKTFLTSISTAVIRSIKKIVFSKELNVNYTKQIVSYEPYYHSVLVFCKSNNYADIIILYNVKKSVSENDILNSVKKLTLNNEPINDVWNIQFVDS